jgi:hypothetical protein
VAEGEDGHVHAQAITDVGQHISPQLRSRLLRSARPPAADPDA